MDYQTLLKQYPGYAGWGENEALADYNATGGSGKGGSSGGYGSSGRYVGEVDLSQIPSVTEFIKGQFGTENEALTNLIMAMRAREKPLDIYSRLETEAGLPELRATSKTLSKEIANIEDYLDQIEPNVSARTRESLVTEAQRQGMVGAEKKPWTEKLSKLGTSLGRIQAGISEATQGVATKTELGLRGQEMELEPAQLAYTTMVDRNARLLTGFTTDRQTQLDVLFDKINRQRELSDQEWELANTLAGEEREYLKNLQSAAAQAGVTVTGDESVDELLTLIGITAKEAITWEREYKLKTLAKSGASAASKVDDAISNIKSITSNSTNPQNDAWSYVWSLQNKQPDLFDSSGWNQLWSYVSGLPTMTESTAKSAGESFTYTYPDGTSVTF